MPITATQKESRKQHLGSSDMAAVLGLDTRRSPYDVWLEKTGRLEEEPESEIGADDPRYAGKMFEDAVLDHAQTTLGKLQRNQYRSLKSAGVPLGANVDAIVVASGDPVEAKTAGLFGPLYEEWGDAETDEVPERVIVQSHVHMLVTNPTVCHVPAFLGGRGFVMFRVPWNETIGQVIQETAVKFWNGHVLTDTPPDDSLPTAKVIKKIRRMPESVKDIDYELVERWLEAKAICKAAETAKDNVEVEMLAALGDAEGGATTAGLLTYLKQSRTAIDSKALKAAMPDVYEQFARVSEYRVPRWKLHK